uniref:RING-type E3 ubiquitin transferase n=1 Tax=Rhizophora mucronata TaxID=61149 RepID=A0A2P2IPB0_RHIMU
MAMAIGSYIITSRSTWYQLPRLHTAIFSFLYAIFHISLVCCSKIDASYGDHCASIVVEAVPTEPEFTTIPFTSVQHGYYSGGDGLRNLSKTSEFYYSPDNQRTLLFQTNHVYRTEVRDVFKVEATLILQASGGRLYVEDMTYSYSYSPQVFPWWSERGALSFELEGFWSKSTGELCMVGSGSIHPQEGNPRVLAAVLKLYGVKSSVVITSLIRGTFESLSSPNIKSPFKPISMLMFPRTSYNYTAVSKEFDLEGAGEDDLSTSASLRLPLGRPICSMFRGWFPSVELTYSSNCNFNKTCNPLGKRMEYLPKVMHFSLIQCSDDRQGLRLLVEFLNPNSTPDGYYRSFTPNATLVAEGLWNAKKNKLNVVACRILNATDSFINSSVGDCSFRLSLRFPAVWSIKHTRGIVGHIWSNKHVNDSGYFEKIIFQGERNDLVGIPGLKYEYTMVDEASASCPKDKLNTDDEKQYPEANSNEMLFDMSVKNSGGKKTGWGYSSPIAVGNQIIPQNSFVISSSSSTPAKPPVKKKTTHSNPLNISYKMSVTPSYNASSREQKQIKISAEGIYDADTGIMCMVGCKTLDSESQKLANASMDCEILINLQFPPVDSSDHITGHIESRRKRSDPSFFEPLQFSAISLHARKPRIDLEIIMSLISITLVCIFVGYQILYARRHPSVFSFISLLMLVILTLGHMIPLVLNFEALFMSKHDRWTSLYRSGGWLEVNEVIVRALTMVAFLLQCRLLMLVWSKRFTGENQKASWAAEKKTLYVSLPLYIAGGLIALYVNWRNGKPGDAMHSTSINSQQLPVWEGLRSYAGLVLDGFLFPQILLNIFQNSKENALSRLFYMGNTLVRLLPHAYDLYRGHGCADEFDWSYLYAIPITDYYSTAWDIIIPLVGLLFAAIIYKQQCFGGRCFLPKRFRELEAYEKIPVTSDA